MRVACKVIVLHLTRETSSAFPLCLSLHPLSLWVRLPHGSICPSCLIHLLSSPSSCPLCCPSVPTSSLYQPHFREGRKARRWLSCLLRANRPREAGFDKEKFSYCILDNVEINKSTFTFIKPLMDVAPMGFQRTLASQTHTIVLWGTAVSIPFYRRGPGGIWHRECGVETTEVSSLSFPSRCSTSHWHGQNDPSMVAESAGQNEGVPRTQVPCCQESGYLWPACPT